MILSETDKIRLRGETQIFDIILSDELFYSVGINVVAIRRKIIIIARYVIHPLRRRAVAGSAKDACPFYMGTLTALDLTNTCVAKIRAFIYVTVWALGSLVTVSIGPKSPTYGIALGMLSMEIGAGRVDTLSLGEMHT